MDPDPPPAVNRRTSAARMKEQLGVIILTTFGIIQGAVLADLAVVVADSAKEFVAAQWCMALAAFGLIIVIWSHTVAESVALSWVPNFADMVAPFVAGVMEFYLNHALGAGLAPWLVGTLALSLFLLVAYPIIESLAGREAENQAMLAHLRPQRRGGRRLALGGLLLHGGLFLAVLVMGMDVTGPLLGFNVVNSVLTQSWVMSLNCRDEPRPMVETPGPSRSGSPKTSLVLDSPTTPPCSRHGRSYPLPWPVSSAPSSAPIRPRALVPALPACAVGLYAATPNDNKPALATIASPTRATPY